MKKGVVRIGCGAHFAYGCVHSACDTLPVEVTALVVKIYKYFYMYTVRVTELVW
jgi:hypothetical protein